MTKEIGVIAIHGMGETKQDFADKLEDELYDEVGAEKWNKIHFDTIFYQTKLQANQNRVFRNMKKQEIDFIKLRKFFLYGFSDAAGLERRAHDKNSPYEIAQTKVLDTINRCAHKLGGYTKPLVIVAHSLGCQVISNYIWDSQARTTKQGVWKNKKIKKTNEDKFRRLKTLKSLYTTGCNIPIFVAGFPDKEIQAIKTNSNGYHFLWHNYYDEDDALGWPMRPLSSGYKSAVYKDYQINADGGFLGKFFRGWNPLSHGGYWTDSELIEPLAEDIANSI